MTTKFENSTDREKWHKKSTKKFWINGSYQNYDPAHRLWVITTLTKDLAMVDSEVVIDEDGGRVYRTVFMINKDGSPCVDHGFLRCFDKNYLRAQHVEPVNEAYQKKLDLWVKSMTECVERKNSHGFIYDALDYKPCRLRIPGWEKMSKKDLQKRQEANFRNMARMFTSGMF